MRILPVFLFAMTHIISFQALFGADAPEEASKFLAELTAGDQSSVHWGTRKFDRPGLYITGKSKINQDVSSVEVKIGDRTDMVLEITNGLSSQIFIAGANDSSKIMDEEGNISWAITNPSPFYLLPERSLVGDLLTARSGYFIISFPYHAPSRPGIQEKWLKVGLCLFSMGDKQPTRVTISRKVKVIVVE